MATQEWIATDEEIWDWDGTDNFIWLPDVLVDGVGMFVAVGQLFQYSADIEPAQYVADIEVFQYAADRRD